MIHYSNFFLATNVYEIMTLWTKKQKIDQHSQPNLNQFSSGFLFLQKLNIIKSNLK